MNELALFAGAGGGLLGSHLLGWSTKCAVELAPYPRRVLLTRQRDGVFEPFPIWSDIRTFDGYPWRKHIDVVTGGFPCQDISAAGKGKGLTGARSGLWFEMLRVIGEVQPTFVFAENSPRLRTRGLGTIVQGLTRMGYDVRWCVLGARHAGAPHRRDRMWILATHPKRLLLRQQSGGISRQNRQGTSQSGEHGTSQDVANTYGGRFEEQWLEEYQELEGSSGDQPDGRSERRRGDRQDAHPLGDRLQDCLISRSEEGATRRPSDGRHPCWWPPEPDVGRVVSNGMAHRVDRLKAIGNGQVPRVAALAWNILRGE